MYIFIIKVKIAGYDSLESGAFTVEKVPENQRQKVAGDEVSQKRIRAPTHGSIVSIYIIYRPFIFIRSDEKLVNKIVVYILFTTCRDSCYIVSLF